MFLCVCVCMCALHAGSQHQGSSPATVICVGKRVYAHKYCTCESTGRDEVRGIYRHLPQQSSVLFLEAGSLTKSDTYISARLRTCLSPKLGFQAPGPIFGFYGGTRDLNSGPLTCPLLLLPLSYLLQSLHIICLRQSLSLNLVLTDSARLYKQ